MTAVPECLAIQNWKERGKYRKIHKKMLILAVLFFTSMSCLLNKFWIDRNRLFQLLSHRKRCCINVFQIFPWLITYREWTEGNFLNSFFCLLFSGVRGFSQKNRKSRSHCVAVRVTWAHCCFTVHIKKLYIQYVHSQQSSSPGEEHRGYGKQVWRLSFIRSVSFVSLFSSVGWARSQLCALTHTLPPRWEINTHQSNTGQCWS